MLVSITGASGFIGSYTAAALHRVRHHVRALVRESSRRDHIEPFVTEWVVGTQNDPNSVNRLVSGGVDAVIHNAVSWNRIATVELPDIEDNVIGSLRILESARL